jgi:NADH-quinone oxidoreductase subunit M
LGCAILLLNQYNAGENISMIHQWINQPNISFALQADGLAIAMILLTLALTLSLYFFFENMNAKAFYALILLWLLPWQEHS